MENTAIFEDDQQLYDWGIERLDQYYMNPENHFNGAHHGYHQNYESSYNHPHRHNHSHHHLHHHHVQNSHQQQLQRGFLNHGESVENYLGQSPQVHHHQPLNSNSSSFETPLSDGNTQNKKQFFPCAVDMDINETLKVERKRARNRVAASKCRLRKLERISILDHQATQLRADNNELAVLSSKLKSEIYALKEELRWHLDNGCNILHQNKSDDISPYQDSCCSPESTLSNASSSNYKPSRQKNHVKLEPVS